MAIQISPHVKRWLTGVIAVPLLVLIIVYGSDALFSLLIGAVMLIGVHEYNDMVFDASCRLEKWEGLILTIIIFLAMYAGDPALVLAVMTISVLTVLCLSLWKVQERTLDFVPIAKVILGLMYVPLLMSHFILIRRFNDGILWVFFVLVLAFAGDTGAFYVGRTWGKRKLLPAVSPGKTMEGILGLVGGAVLACVVYQQLLLPGISVAHVVVLAFVGSLLGQLGDLCESLIKRASGVKDSGAILPGHGGILDRLDSLLFIVPFVYYYCLFVVT